MTPNNYPRPYLAGIVGSGGYWPPRWWGWGKAVFVVGGIVGWVLLLWRF